MQSTTSTAVAEPPLLADLVQDLAALTDQRKPRGLRYPLTPLLVLLVLAKVCGANHPLEIARWVQYRHAWLTEALGLRWKRMPHPATFRRLLQSAISVPHLEEIAGHYLAALGDHGGGLLNLDGKTLRGTRAPGETQGLQLLALQQATENRVVEQTALSQQENKKENEISAAKRLLKKADLAGQIVSGDAIFAQRQLSRQVVNQGGDYLWKVKENQKNLLRQLAQWLPPAAGASAQIDSARSLEKGHGRIEERILYSSSRLADQLDWPFVSQVFALRSDRFDCRTKHRSLTTHYGITSLPPMEADAERLLALMRGHWAIENGLHYRRDVTFQEDACRMKSRPAAEALAVCTNLALGLLRHAGWENVAEARRYYAAHPDEALRLIRASPP
jgi:predicted transposase YbfD/YdcC